MAILTWAGKRQVHRIDKVEAEKADKQALSELKQDMREHRQETRESFTRIFERLDTIADRLPK